MNLHWKWQFGAIVFASLLSVGAADAQSVGDDPESPLHSLARKTGLATEPPPPADFVRESRPPTPRETIPVFAQPEEPTSTVMTKEAVQKLDAELTKVDKAHDKLRAAYPPSAQAMAEQKADEAKRQAKRAKKPALAPQNTAN